MVRLLVGKAGHAIAKDSLSASSNASATGPILPASVESNVEQYLKKNWTVPESRSQVSAASDIATASADGIERDLSAMTTASARGNLKSCAGTPSNTTVDMP